MPDRLIRADLLTSDAWLTLKNNDDRAAWIACFLTADNFGNMAAGLPRLVHLWRPYGIDTPEKAAKTFAELCDVDLARRYEIDAKPYLHIPRFRQRLRYLGSFRPLSPWNTIEEKQRSTKKSPAFHGESPAVTGESLVDVDVDVDEKPFAHARDAVHNSDAESQKPVNRLTKTKPPNPRPGESQAAFDNRIAAYVETIRPKGK